MKVLPILVISFLIVVPSIMALNSGVIDETSGLETWDMPGRDYPQQDGGSDDRFIEYRSMWLEGYQIVNISEVRAVVQLARENNFNCLSPLINGHYLGVFYDSKYFPKYPEVYWDFDPLMELIKEAHKYNIHVMPWFHTMYNYPALRENPEWRDRTSSGSYTSSWMDPANPGVRNFLVNLTTELFTRYPLDGIKLDTIRYGGSSYGYTDISIQKYYDEGWEDFSDFRRNQITEVVRILYNTIMDIRPYAWVGADIWHQYSSWYSYVFQDSRRWAAEGIIDFVTTMSYTTSTSSFESNLQDNLDNFACQVVAGPYVFVPGNTAHGSVPSEEAGIEILVDQTSTTQRLGALGTCHFAYKFLREWPAYCRALREGPFSQKALCPLKEQKHPVSLSRWEFENDHDREGWRTTDMGQFYPIDGLWSVSNVRSPKFMSPLLNLSATGTNVLEIRVISESRRGDLKVYWSPLRTNFLETRSYSVQIKNSGDWSLYSIHLDQDPEWISVVRYIRIVFDFPEPTNITIDSIEVTWMPYCIRSWGYLGPFYSGGKDDLLERDFIGNETSVLPRIGEIMGGRQWRRFSMERDKVDLQFVLGDLQDASTYSHVYVRSDFEGPVELRIGNSDGSIIWLNGEMVFTHTGKRTASPDQNVTYVMIRKGVNTLLMKQAVYGDDHAYFMRLTLPGNRTADDLEFYDELPLLDEPEMQLPIEDWFGSDTVELKWAPPSNSTGLDHYEWSLDGSDHIPISGENLVIDSLEDGTHLFEIRCVDNLGFPGRTSSTTIRIDTDPPQISKPETSGNIITDGSITWSWDLISEPLSGIQHYLVTIKTWVPGTPEVNILLRDHPVQSCRFTLKEGIKDGNLYRCEVRAVSGSGLVHSPGPSENVLVDISPPSIPVGLDISLKEMGKRTYVLSWTPSTDNTNGGLDHYEVWWLTGGAEWVLYNMTRETYVEVERPLYCSMELKVRAVDGAGHLSPFSQIIRPDNSAPMPSIETPLEIRDSVPFRLRTGGIADIDGEVLEYRWYINNQMVSMQREFSISLPQGEYEIWLWVIDDLGADGSVREMITIQPGTDSLGSISQWLHDTSGNEIQLGPVNITHYENRSVVIDPVTRDGEADKDRTAFSDVLIFILAVGLTILLLLLFSRVAVNEFLTFEHIRYAKIDWEDEKGYGSQDFMDRILMNPLLRKEIERRAVDSSRPLAPPMSRENLSSPSRPNLPHKDEGPIIISRSREIAPVERRSEDEIWDDNVDIDEYEEWEVEA
ncbi:MAG: family 10 glycosylhydrolase [Thermoplasmatota archaeon]